MTLLTLSLLCGTESEQLGFANALLAEGDHYRAIGEYKRFLYLYPESPAADEARLAIARAYTWGGQTEAAVEHLRSLSGLSPEWRARARLEMGWALRVGGDNEAAARQLRSFLSLNEDASPRSPSELDRARYLLGWALLHQGDGEGAARAFASVSAPAPVMGLAAFAWNGLFGFALH